MNESRKISAKTQHSFYILPHFSSKLLDRFSPSFHTI